jgi:Ca-activated chloride channel family protein
MVKQAAGAGPGFRRHVPPLLFLIAFAVMIAALARPAAIVTLPSQRGTVILAMDISGSMRADDVDPSRMAAAQAAARTFIEQQPKNVQIGIVAFGGGATVVQVPTLEKQDALDSIERFRLQRGTAVGSGILASLSTIFEDLELQFGMDSDEGDVDSFGGFGRSGGSAGAFGGLFGRTYEIPRPEVEKVQPGSYRQAVVILLTDGQATHGPDPLQAAEIARDLGVRVFTVGLGTPEGVVIGFGGRSMRVILDEESLETIAERTDADYFRATSETDLNEIYEYLSAQFVLETEKTEITAGFTGLAALLALVAAALSVLWFGRIL